MTDDGEIQALRELVRKLTEERDALQRAIKVHQTVNPDPRASDQALYKVLPEDSDD